MWPPASAEITVPTNNSPLPRGPHTCHHSPPQPPETHLPLTHLQSSLFQRLYTQTHTHTHTHIPSCHSFRVLTHIHSYTHRRVTLRCAQTAFPSAKFLSAHLHAHTCTHTRKWWEGVWDRTVSKPAALSDRGEKEVGGMSPPPGMPHHLTYTAYRPQSPWTPGGLPRTQSPACHPQFGVLGFLKCSYRMFSRVTVSLFS